MPLVRFAILSLTGLLFAGVASANPGVTESPQKPVDSQASTPSSLGGPFHGLWVGTMVLVERCQNGQTYPQTLQSSLSITQNGSAINGVVLIKDGLRIGDRECVARERSTGTLLFSGTTSGNSFSASVTLGDGGGASMSGSINGSTLSGSFGGSGKGVAVQTTSGNFTFTKSAADPATSGLTGTWLGSYTYKNTVCPSHSGTGPIKATFFQDGDLVPSTLLLENVKTGPCMGTSTETAQLGFTARLSGNVLTATWVESQSDGEARASFSATISGATINGSLSVSHPLRNEELKFTATNTSASPAVQSFTATPSQIRPGEPVSLLWSTLNATSISIDNGVGTQPASGSVRVTPNATTNYTLTATGPAGSVTATATVNVVSTPSVSVSAFPNGMLQLAGAAGATDRYILVNTGGASTTITLRQNGNFFTQSPTTFTLSPGGSQEVAISALTQPAGAYNGVSIPSGNGVPNGLTIPVKLLVGTAPSGTTSAVATTNRVDALGSATAATPATASFRNTGTAAIEALVISDAPWLIPQNTPVTIPPNGSANVSFTLDPARRIDSADPVGSVAGNLTLRFLTGSGSTKDIQPHNGASTGSSSVSVTFTISLVTAVGEPPPLSPGEVALFLPGMGHVTGSVGVFVSDLTLLNRSTLAKITDGKMFFSPLSGAASLSANISQLSANQAVGFADVVKTIFGLDASNGSMQIRSKDAAKLALAANVFNSSNPKGTYGTVIPAFRSDRGVPAGDNLFLTGLRADSNSHTNLYIQETSGFPVTVRIDFYDASGGPLGTPRTETLGGFKLLQLGSAAPIGAVSAILTNDAASQGRFLAYATPVDRASGDTWAVGDWARLGAFSGAEPVVIPVAGSAPGANNAFFRTDLAIMNSGTSTATGTLKYIGRAGETSEKSVSISPRASSILVDVVASYFGITTPTVGYIIFTPASGNFAVNSRTYTTTPGQAATFGTSIPAIPLASSLRVGQMRQFGGIEDSALTTIQAARPGTFRTNFGMVETSGQPATVRVTVHYTFSAAGTLVSGRATASKEYSLAPRQFLQLSRLSAEIMGAARDSSFGDMRDLQVDFEVLSGSGTTIVFVSSVDNGTADSTTRTD